MTLTQSSTSLHATHYQHLSSTERGQIEALHRQNFAIREIARQLHRNAATISRELKRGTTTQMDTNRHYFKVYFADTGVAVYEKHRSKSHAKGFLKRAWLFFAMLITALKQRPRVDSVDSFVHRFKQRHPEAFCPSTPTVYRYVHAGLVPGLRDLDLPQVVNRRRKHGHGHQRMNQKSLGQSIEQRPMTVESREDFGNWEGDLVKGKRVASEPALLTLTERKTRFEYIIKLDNYHAATCREAVQELVNTNPQIFKTVTFDNGSEFSELNQLTDTEIYFAHPYSPWERGSNEQANGQIRESIPKGKSLHGFSADFITQVQAALNQRLRRCLNYQSSQACFNLEILAMNETTD